MFERPKTAYEACHMAADMINKFELNYWQDMFKVGVNDAYRDDLRVALEAELNVCHTAYCRVGWICVLTIGQEDEKGILKINDSDITKAGGWESMGQYLMGIKRGPISADFDNLMAAQAVDEALFGTPEYAKQGADGLRQFAEKWRTHLEGVVYTYPIDPREASTWVWAREDEGIDWDSQDSDPGDEEDGDDE